MEELIPYLGKILDSRFAHRLLGVRNKRLVIFHKEKDFSEAFDAASWSLNIGGLTEFKNAVDNYETR